jgi:hypothetical protein
MPVQVRFGAVPGANTYNIEAVVTMNNATITPDFNNATLFECNASTTTAYTFTPFPDGTTVYWRVRGHNATEYGNWSATQSFIVSSSAPLMPVIASVAPSSGPVGATVAITGENLSGATVFFGNIMATVISNSPTQIIVRVPNGATTGAIRVVNAGGSVTLATPFTIVIMPTPPSITAFSPQSGPVGTIVTISGINFVPDSTSVFFNGIAASGVVVTNSSQLIVSVPNGASTGPITVVTRSGTGASATNFTVTTAAPLRPIVGAVMGTAQGGASIAGTQLLLRERTATFIGVQSAAQSGTVLIGAPPQTITRPVPVTFALSYLDSLQRPLSFGATSALRSLPVALPPGARSEQPFPAPVATPTNSVLGDISPQLVNGSTITPLIGPTTTVTISNDTPFLTLRFTARWSDQTFVPRSNGVQGPRTARVSIIGSSDYDTNPIAQSATVQLNDPPNVAPVVLNSLQDIGAPPGISEIIELEDPAFRPDGKSRNVFYDDNFDELTYSVSSSNPSVATATIVQRDSTRQFRPTLSIRVFSSLPPDAQAVFTVTARDRRGGTATLQFRYILRLQPPLISSFMPTMGPEGTVVVILGAFFDRIQSLSFGGVAATPTSVDAGVQIIVSVPRGARTGPISITNLSGTTTSPGVFTVTPMTSIRNVRVMNDLLHVLPHPITNEAAVRYTLPERGWAEVELFDAVGHRVQTLAAGEQEAGEYHIRLRSENLSSGVYALRVRGTTFIAQQMVSVTK